jgi:hypothetical protein
MDNEATLVRLAEGFRRKDVDSILAEFADDGVLETFTGPDPCGERYAGKTAIRAALEHAFKGPDFVMRISGGGQPVIASSRSLRS